MTAEEIEAKRKENQEKFDEWVMDENQSNLELIYYYCSRWDVPPKKRMYLKSKIKDHIDMITCVDKTDFDFKPSVLGFVNYDTKKYYNARTMNEDMSKSIASRCDDLITRDDMKFFTDNESLKLSDSEKYQLYIDTLNDYLAGEEIEKFTLNNMFKHRRFTFNEKISMVDNEEDFSNNFANKYMGEEISRQNEKDYETCFSAYAKYKYQLECMKKFKADKGMIHDIKLVNEFVDNNKPKTLKITFVINGHEVARNIRSDIFHWFSLYTWQKFKQPEISSYEFVPNVTPKEIGLQGNYLNRNDLLWENIKEISYKRKPIYTNSNPTSFQWAEEKGW